MDQNPDNRSVRRIVLPSGRSIEVLKLDFDAPPRPGLHLCPECESPLMQPLQWREVQPRSWALTLLCPNCDCLNDGVFAQEQVDRFEEQLDRGLAEMLSDLRRLTQANMSEEIDRFVAGLQADLILPEDF
jgi:hypothetical protein